MASLHAHEQESADHCEEQARNMRPNSRVSLVGSGRRIAHGRVRDAFP